MNQVSSIRQLKAGLTPLLRARGFVNDPKTDLFIARHNQVVCGIEVCQSRRDPSVAQVLLYVWHPQLSSGAVPKSVSALSATLVREGIQESNALGDFSRRLRLDLQSVDVLLEQLTSAFDRTVLPFLSALRTADDLIIVCALSGNGPPDRRKLDLVNHLRTAGWDTAGEILRLELSELRGMERLGTRYELVDALRLAELISVHPMGAALRNAGFSPHGRPAALPQNYLVYTRPRDGFIDVLDFNLSAYGASTIGVCFVWVPEMDGLPSSKVSAVPEQLRPTSAAQWWFGRDGPASEEVSYNLFDRETRAPELDAIFQSFARVDTWLKAKTSLKDLFDFPPTRAANALGAQFAESHRQALNQWKDEVLGRRAIRGVDGMP